MYAILQDCPVCCVFIIFLYFILLYIKNYLYEDLVLFCWFCLVLRYIYKKNLKHIMVLFFKQLYQALAMNIAIEASKTFKINILFQLQV